MTASNIRYRLYLARCAGNRHNERLFPCIRETSFLLGRSRSRGGGGGKFPRQEWASVHPSRYSRCSRAATSQEREVYRTRQTALGPQSPRPKPPAEAPPRWMVHARAASQRCVATPKPLRLLLTQHRAPSAIPCLHAPQAEPGTHLTTELQSVVSEGLAAFDPCGIPTA